MSEAVGEKSCIIGGVDTHKDTHTAAALDLNGRVLGNETFAASSTGYAAVLRWFQSFGQVVRVGIEGTGSYGSGLARHLRDQHVSIVEVNRPNRQTRRRHGKSDPADAEAAARATLSGDASGVPKSQDGVVEVIRILRLERRSAIQARTQAANQLHAVVSTAPEVLRANLRELPLTLLISRTSKLRDLEPRDAISATKCVLRGLAGRWLYLDREVARLDARLGLIVKKAAPGLVALHGVGVEVAGALLDPM